MENVLIQGTDILTGGSNAPSSESALPERSWVPLWLHAGPAGASDEQAKLLWDSLARRDPLASIHFLPSVALGARQNQGTPLIYADWAQADEKPIPKSLAILPVRDLSVQVLPGLSCSISLKGRRVVDSSLLGDSSPQALRAFASSMAQFLERGQAECIIFPDIDSESPLRQALADAARQYRVSARYPSKPAPHWWIRFPEQADQYWSQFSKKTRYNFRYRAKHLDHSVRCIREVAEVPAFLDTVLDLSQRTWQHRRLGAKIDVARKLELWSEIARAGAFRSYLLEQGGKALAFATCFQWKDHFIYEETGYDPEFAAKSPGQVLLFRIIEDLIANKPPRLFDFGYGDNEYKRIFANHQTLSGPVVLVSRALRPMVAMGLGEFRSDLGKAARIALTRLGVASMIRHIHRGHRGANKAGNAADKPPTGGEE